jgi:glucose-1-phosphate thymidylyltransferase
LDPGPNVGTAAKSQELKIMRGVILAATYEKRLDPWGREVPLPLVDVGGKTYLDGLIESLSKIPGLTEIDIVTNAILHPPLVDWMRAKESPIALQVISDGTTTPETRLGAVGDLSFCVRRWQAPSDFLLVGGHNWFTFDLAQFVAEAVPAAPAVVVTEIPLGARPERFGWVRLDERQRIVEFREHAQPPVPAGARKASCVYYFASDQIGWLDRYAESHSINCSPGTFVAWLAEQIPVFGVPMQGALYNLGRRVVLRGADRLELQNILRERVNEAMLPWERAAAARLNWAASHVDLIDALRDSDVNVRIIAVELLEQVAALVDEMRSPTPVSTTPAMEVGNPRMRHLFSYQRPQRIR